MEKFYLSKAVGGYASPTPPPLGSAITALVKVRCDMIYSIHTVEHRWRLGSFEDTTSILIVGGKLV